VKLTIALVFALNGPSASASVPGGRWLATDKVKHFFMAAFVQSTTYSAFRATTLDHRSSLVGATVLSAGLSVAKELSDRRTTGFSVPDLVWDAAGIGTSTVVLDRIRR
jgi:uncharacterized protein YfiM (DUF2279 family)